MGIRQFGVDVPICHQDVFPAVLIDIKERDAPANEPVVNAKTSLVCLVIEVAVSLVVVEGGSLAHEIRPDDIDATIVIVVCGGHPHAALFLTIWSIRNTAFDGNIRERAIVIIVEQNT